MIYELWDTESNNVIATCDSEAEVLAIVRAQAQRHGDQAVDRFSLLRADGEHVSGVAGGSALLARAGETGRG